MVFSLIDADCSYKKEKQERGAENMVLKNFTPHPVTIFTDEARIKIPSDGEARCVEVVETLDPVEFHGVFIPVQRKRFENVAGLPEPTEGVGYIVSALIATALPDRTDLFIPSEIEHARGGAIIGCRALGVV